MIRPSSGARRGRSSDRLPLAPPRPPPPARAPRSLPVPGLLCSPLRPPQRSFPSSLGYRFLLDLKLGVEGGLEARGKEIWEILLRFKRGRRHRFIAGSCCFPDADHSGSRFSAEESKMPPGNVCEKG
ncbi:uncharacterized protein LOC100432581 [Pongo abelii]|uniref:uncharacterized protein LOC100432581 n=1 Tax=Pongo abelii TaxID=9601 RepID=UPI0023E895D1|nr:uncharacterized protein LOC100432581 [Pongo abelii]